MIVRMLCCHCTFEFKPGTRPQILLFWVTLLACTHIASHWTPEHTPHGHNITHTHALLYILIKFMCSYRAAQRMKQKHFSLWNFAAVGPFSSRPAAIVVKWPQRAAFLLVTWRVTVPVAGNEWTVNLQQCWGQRKGVACFTPSAWLNASNRCHVIGWGAVAIGMQAICIQFS